MSGPEEPSLSGLKILVAEDESVIAYDLMSALERFGCEVLGPVKRVEEVVSIVRASRIDGALLDVNLRGRRIFDVLPSVLARGVKVVLTSGYAETLFPSEYRSLPRLSKPFDERSLRRVCAENFASRRAD